MNKIIYFLMLGFLFSCGSQDIKEPFVINATLPNFRYDKQYAYLKDMTDERIVIDSVIVNDGNFTFKGTSDTDFIASVVVGKHKGIVILEPGEIVLDMSAMGLVSGTPMNDSFAAYYKKYSAYIDSMSGKVVESSDIHGITALEQEEIIRGHMEHYKYRLDSLARNTVAVNNNSLGAIVMMLASSVFTPTEYMNLYQAAGEKIKNNHGAKLLYDRYLEEKYLQKIE